jgi:hypothetical protein
MGAYSSSHRPTISGGKPNSRVAWGLARLNAFIYKKDHGVSKSGKYNQDDDLMERGGLIASSGTLTTKDQKSKIDYKKIGDSYEFVVYNGQHKKRNGNKAIMTYNQFVNYLYSEGYIDDRYEDGGELSKGIKTEQEHRKTLEKIASGKLTVDQAIERTAKDHLKEDPKYYTKLLKMESKMATGGGVSEPSFKLNTPTGEPSKLTYTQQVLVRTQTFKKWFGDWESAAKMFLADNKENFKKHYEGVSKVLDMTTLEPRLVYHGTRSSDEFFMFDVSREKGVGRPYAYFAHEIEYSKNFTRFSQRGHSDSAGFLYKCFLNVRNPFMALGRDYEMKYKNSENWLPTIVGTMAWDKYETVAKNEKTENLERAVKQQIGDYLDRVAEINTVPFWNFMARDVNSDFKYFLVSYGYDGIFYTEELVSDFDPNNPAQYTKAVTVFSPNDIKLADGRNLDFNPMEADIRLEEGGEIEQSPASSMNKKEELGNLLFGDKYARGGNLTDLNNIIQQSPQKEVSKERMFVDDLIKKMKNGI